MSYAFSGNTLKQDAEPGQEVFGRILTQLYLMRHERISGGKVMSYQGLFCTCRSHPCPRNDQLTCPCLCSKMQICEFQFEVCRFMTRIICLLGTFSVQFHDRFLMQIRYLFAVQLNLYFGCIHIKFVKLVAETLIVQLHRNQQKCFHNSENTVMQEVIDQIFSMAQDCDRLSD